MSDIDDLLESLDNQEEYDNKLLEIIKELNLQIPKLEERKKERDAKRYFIENSPPGFLIEIAPKLLQIEKGDEEKLGNCIPGLLHEAELTIDTINSTGGTASPYISGAYKYIASEDKQSTWFEPVIQKFDDLAKYKTQKSSISFEADKLYQGLGDMFNEALTAVEMSRKDLGNLSSAIMAMRNFLQSMWGNILDLARQTKPQLWENFQKSGLGQSDVRNLVSKSLGENPTDKKKLVLLLNEMSELYNEMSSNQIGKNLQFDNKTKFNTLFSRWLLLIDGLVKIV